MRWLSESVEVLVARELRDADGQPIVHDAVVVGSGYGGAVSALRLAEQGVRVLVLERGKEYLSGEFPDDLGEAFGHVRVERDGASNVGGYESGLYDLRLGDGVGALVGNALGGTSQINANVVLAPDPRIFEKKRGNDLAWPRRLREPGALKHWYAKARAALEVERFSTLAKWREDDPEVEPLKLARLRELEGDIREAEPQCEVSLEAPDLTVKLAGTVFRSRDRDDEEDGDPRSVDGIPVLKTCRSCGECVSGCNWRAKKTLTTNYLPRARQAGARLFTEVSVLRVEQAPQGHWIVLFVRTESRKMHRDGVPVAVEALHARHVVLSAGTLGSTEILMRSHLDSISPALGEHLSTNGDSLAFGYMLEKRVNGMGIGRGAINPTEGVGPTITGILRIDDEADVTQSMLIQDGAVPRAIAGLFDEMSAMSATLAQLDKREFRDMPPDGTPPEEAMDWAALQPRARTNTQTLLGIGHDPSLGKLRLDKEDRLRMTYPKDGLKAVGDLHDRYMRQVEKRGAIYLPNPAIRPLPPGVNNVLSGPRINNGAFTVHPLGGCCMSDDPARGVVDHIGRVYRLQGGQPAHYDGLYVLDGSIVPTSLGANPLLTIAALAERAMAVIAPCIAKSAKHERRWSDTLAEPPLQLRPPPNPFASEVEVNFTEAMRTNGAGMVWERQRCDAHLLLHLPVDDLVLFGTDGRHTIPIPNQLGAVMRDKERLRPRLRIDTTERDDNKKVKQSWELLVEAGWVSILPVPRLTRRSRRSAWLRAMWTWWVERGHDEICRHFRGLETPSEKSGISLRERFRGFLKMSRHASEERTMEYRLHLREANPQGDSAKTYVLRGTKHVGYPASWQALLASRRHQKLDRPNVWSAFGELKATIEDDHGKPVASCTLVLDMQDMTRMHAPQLALQRDTPNALLTLAGYPLWFARLVAKTRLWDFRLPDYPQHIPPELIPASFNGAKPVPVPPMETPEGAPEWEAPWPDFPPLRVRLRGENAKRVHAKPTEFFPVQAVNGKLPSLELALTRYPQQEVTFEDFPDGTRRFKVMLMLNGFAQSTLGFVPQEHCRNHDAPNKNQGPYDEPGLAEFFYEQGYDVWLLDYRTSSLLEASKQPSTMDEIARYDIPVAVKRVLRKVCGEAGMNVPPDGDPPEGTQILAFAHCVGAASMAMSLLAGYLRYPESSKFPAGANMLAGVTLSQMQAFLVGSKTAQMRLRVGGVLRDTMGIDFLRLSAAEREPNALESVLDRLFASLPVDPGEHCPNEFSRVEQRPDICTCKRMSGTISRLLKHDRIKPETHARLPVYFGRANTSLLVHGGQCVENERLVDAEGRNVYVTDDNIQRNLRLPVAIMHGKHNALFDVESAHRTLRQISRVNGDLASAGLYKGILAEDFGHFDCTIGYGKLMHEQILVPLRDFYAGAWHAPMPAATAPPPPALVQRTMAKAPLTGPIVGWVRTEQDGGKLIRRVRLWIEVDDSEANPAAWAVTHCTRHVGGRLASGRKEESTGPGTQLWPVTRVALPAAAAVATPQPAYIAIAVADLAFDLQRGKGEDHETDVRVDMFSVHRVMGPPAPTTSSPGRDIPAPLTQQEFDAAYVAGLFPLGNAPDLRTVMDKVRNPDLAKALGDLGRGLPMSGHLDLRGELAGLKRMLPLAGDLDLQQELADLESTLPAAWKPDLPTPRPAEETLSPSNAALLRDVLRNHRWRLHQRALEARPTTLSRKERRLALRTGNGEARALLRKETLRVERPDDGVSFFAASCRHPGLAFEDTRSDDTLEKLSQYLTEMPFPAQFMLMLGDQIYADATAGLMDSPSPSEKVIAGHRRAFGSPGFYALTRTLPTYMVLDDHEIGDNWTLDLVGHRPGVAGGRNAHAERQAKLLADTARKAFGAFQWSHGPRYNSVRPAGTPAPFNTGFEHGGCEFFVLDTRSQRRRFGGAPQVCDPDQIQELKAWLDAFPSADRTPKFVVSGSVLAPGLRVAHWGAGQVSDLMSDTWQMAQEQRREVLQHIGANRIHNVVFVAGDYHCAATATLDFGGGLRAYAVVSPSLYAQLPAANVKHWQILRKEIVWLDLEKKVDIRAEASHGDGFAHVRAIPGPNGWVLEVGLYQTDTADKTPRRNSWPKRFVLA
jgi:choline dehydrogenase-like flavoprotein